MAIVLRPPGSRESLPETLADLGSFRKRVALATGLFTFIFVVVGLTALACVLDSWFHLPPLARAFALAIILALGGVCWLRGVAWAWGLRTDSLSVALELEEKHPALNDALASAVSFLEAGDAAERGLSNRLQETAVKHARRMADRHDLDHLARTGACWRAAWACLIVVAVVAGVVIGNGPRASTALARLADPFGVHPWPTKTRIEVLVPEANPARVPKGEPFTLKFLVRGTIKDRAVVTFRIAGGNEFSEEYPLSAGNDPKYAGAATISARIDAARLPSSFSFKIASNDTETEWSRVNVVPPPQLVSLPEAGVTRPSPQCHLTPPAYTGLPSLDLDLPEGTTLEIPIGTVVRMRAAIDLRLSRVVLAFTGDRTTVSQLAGLSHLGNRNPFTAFAAPYFAGEIGGDIPVSLDPSGRVLSVVFAPTMSGTYALRMTDETGLTGTRPIEIRLIPDPAPNVTLLRPAAGKDPLVLTPAAIIPLHVLANDKLYAVRRTFLEYTVGREGDTRTIPLLDVNDLSGTLPAVVGGVGVLAQVRPLSAEARGYLPLSAFTRADGSPLRDGDVLFIRGAADDWDDLTPAKPPGRSAVLEIRIASPETVEAWLQRELAGFRNDLKRLRDQQRDARQKTGEVVTPPDGTLAPDDRNRLLASEQAQRLIRGKISDAQEGLVAKAEMLRQTVRANNLPRSNTTDRVEILADELGRLADRDLPVIEPALSEARQLGAQPPRSGQEKVLPELLKKAGRHQKAVEDGLTDLFELLSVWGGPGEVRSEARVLRDFILRQIGDIERMDRPAQPGDLDRAGTRAEQAADQANQLIGRATKLAGDKDKQAIDAKVEAKKKADEAAGLRAKAATLPEGTPEKSVLNAKATILEGEAEDFAVGAKKAASEAEALRTGIKVVGGQSLPDDLRKKAANAIRNDQRENALTHLRSAAALLDKLIDTLTEKPPEPAPDLAKKLKNAANDIDDLAAAQDDLRKRTAEASKIADPVKRAAELKKLATEQEKLIGRGRELFQRLTRERADDAARDVRAAVDRMETARNDLESGATGMRAQNDAVDRLDQARDKLDTAAVEAPDRLSDEKRRKMADKVKALFERQTAGVAEAERVHKLVAGAKNWERDSLTAYGDLQDREKAIAAEVRALEKEFAPLPVLARVLTESAAAMDSAVAKIDTRLKDIDPALAFDPELETANDRRVKRPMELAARRLEQLLEALKQEDPKSGAKKDPPPKTPDPKNPKNPPPPSGQQDIVPPLAQLKVLRALQAELNDRTAEFAKLHPDPAKLTDEERAELKEIEDAQREMAVLFEQIAKLFQDHKQPLPDNPPKSDTPEKPKNPAPEKP